MNKEKEHTTLYRKYRPKTFDDVLGQEQVVRLLRSSIEKNSAHHAYLFSGSRGTGKTSLARIFAKSLNIEDVDIHEIDAASNNSVEDIRTIREEVYSLPFASEKKIYILDEAHMLSSQAWNALLKTLEEPPSHAFFILATTEHHKVPATIISRCQTISFSRPTEAVLSEMIERTAKNEGYSLEKGSAEIIALFADGSFRDAHGTLQKVLLSLEGKEIKRDEVSHILGIPEETEMVLLFNALSKGEKEILFKKVRDIGQKYDMHRVLPLLIRFVRAVLIVRSAPQMKEIFSSEYTKNEWETIEKASEEKKSFINAFTLSLLLDAEINIGHTHMHSLPLELALLRLFEINEKKE
jgi:DNA polymerase III subunit gamma/tau